MPKKEEEKEEKKEKKFKAVTEEVSQTAPAEPVISEPHPLAVTPTDNIDFKSKVSERGAFLKIFLVTFLATLLAFLLAGGIYVYFTGVKTPNGTSTVAPTPLPSQVPEVTPMASPSAAVDLSTFKVNVLNGNGGIGTATAAKNIIEKVGFKVSSVGNADNFNYTDTIIRVKSGVSADVVASLKSALASNYSVSIGDPLTADSSFDITVIVGSK